MSADWKLNKFEKFQGRKGPVVIVIMDGVGIGAKDEGDAVSNARTPVLDRLFTDSLNTQLKAHGTAVGLPSDKDMGNSEVGHNAIGAGRVFEQGASLVTKALESEIPFKGETWEKMVNRSKGNGKLHLIGLLSDGNVHSHIDHVFILLEQAVKDDIKEVCLHPLLDGRDVEPTSAFEYINPLEEKLAEINSANAGFNYRIASGGGRMLVTMDRYEADWRIVERGWNAHVLGEGRTFKSTEEAINTYREETVGIQDQNLPEFVITDKNEAPIGTIEDGDSVIFFNFRGDRAIEISKAFDDKDFTAFDRKRRPEVLFAGIMEYDGDSHIPATFLVPPPALDRTMGEYLAKNDLKQFACSETQKYGHVTYFWNGNKSGKFNEANEDYVEIGSDLIPFNERPWMKAALITDETIKAVESAKYDLIRINYANGDMVGHTGNIDAAVLAVETVDLCLARLLPAIKKAGGIALITADHGNADEMFEWDKKKADYKLKEGNRISRVSHTLNPVPFIIYDPEFSNEYKLNDSIETPGLANIAATTMNLMGLEAPEDYEASLVQF